MTEEHQETIKTYFEDETVAWVELFSRRSGPLRREKACPSLLASCSMFEGGRMDGLLPRGWIYGGVPRLS